MLLLNENIVYLWVENNKTNCFPFHAGLSEFFWKVQRPD